jgi:poly(3-hydroxybutyrate) depolymerase
MLYHLYEFQHAVLTPARLGAELVRTVFQNPWNPLSYTRAGRTMGAGAEMFERLTRRFGKPSFELFQTQIDGQSVDVFEEVLAEKPFCSLIHFRRHVKRKDPKVLIVAPMSGHFATLLRGTVEALLPHHDVYITDWVDARQVPLTEGRFNLDDYVDYVMHYIEYLGSDVHVIAVCQPAVPVFAAAALMEADKSRKPPLSITLMGGPIDTRVSKTKVTELAEHRPLKWFENTVVAEVPFYYPGAFRRVYPGFIQLGGFMSMNLDRHVGSHIQFYHHLVRGDGESADSHRRFYDEYNAVMDISGEFYLQTVETVFQKHSLPKGQMKWRDPATDKLHDVDSRAIRRTALMTIEGELDDISAHGQTTAAHDLAVNLPAARQFHHFQEDVGHYGIFNGRRWREQIMPRIRNFIRRHDSGKDSIPAADLARVPDLRAENWDPKKHALPVVLKYLAEKAKIRGKDHSQKGFMPRKGESA